MKTNHTKGEWKLNKGSKGTLGNPDRDPAFFIQTAFTEITNGPQAQIADVTIGDTAQQIGGHSFEHRIGLNEALANAKLMAAAPELLEALERIKTVIMSPVEERPSGWTRDFLMGYGSEAINKATK